MVLETTTLVDRVPLPTAKRAREKHRAVNWLALFQGTCLVLLEAAGFAVSTLLLVLGLPLFVFLLIAGWDLTALFAQLGRQDPNAKLILVKGAPLELMKARQRRFYFDQGGNLTEKFGIRAVPARVRQNGRMLEVSEITLPPRKAQP